MCAAAACGPPEHAPDDYLLTTVTEDALQMLAGIDVTFDAGRELLSVARQEATGAVAGAMNEGVPLLKKGDLPAAMDSRRLARELLPQNPRALLNLAFMIITRLEEGWNEPLAAQARDALEVAEAVSPGNVVRQAELRKRRDQLMTG